MHVDMCENPKCGEPLGSFYYRIGTCDGISNGYCSVECATTDVSWPAAADQIEFPDALADAIAGGDGRAVWG